MLGFVAENYPNTGAMGLAIMGGVGMLSAGLFVPVIGRLYDQGLARARLRVRRTRRSRCPSCRRPVSKRWARWSILPVILTVVFVLIAVMRKKPATVTAAAHG